MPGFELFGDTERKELNDVLETGILMRYGFDAMRRGHWKARELEQEIEKTLPVKHAQLTSSGTASLNVALAVMGVGYGDEVIMPTFTFVASFEAVLLSGAVPVIVEIDDTLTLDPAAVEAAITPRTKVIMPVHMCGSMADLDPLLDICKRHNLLLLEDACQAYGASYKGKKLGTIGDAGAFSFDFVKTVTCGEGGAVVTNNDKYAVMADRYTDHGHDHVGNDRGAETHPNLGYNFRISELNAAVGLAQVRRTNEFIEIQKRNHAILHKALNAIPEISFRRLPDEEGDSCSFLNFFMPTARSADKAIREFEKNGIDSCWSYYENNWHYIRKWDHLKNMKSIYPLSDLVKKGLRNLNSASFPQSDDFISRNISCLIKLSWTEEEVKTRAEKMVAAIKASL